MPEVREATTVDVLARIRNLDYRRGELWSIAGGSISAANIYRAFLDGRRTPSDASLAMAAVEGYDLMDRYRHLLAEKLTRAVIAKAQAKCLTDEIRRLRAGEAQ
jgi:hypothetical protein